MSDKQSLPTEGFVRLKQILGPNGPLPVSRSSFYAGIKVGFWPAPKKCGSMSLWSVSELRACLDRLDKSTDAGLVAAPSKSAPVG